MQSLVEAEKRANGMEIRALMDAYEFPPYNGVDGMVKLAFKADNSDLTPTEIFMFQVSLAVGRFLATRNEDAQ